MNRLVLLRHAKAEPLAGHASDHDRPLAAEGVTAAREVGAWMRGRNLVPDVVLCSTARRTRETWMLASEGGGMADVATRYVAGLYDTSVGGLLDVLASEAGTVRSVLVVGHEPTLTQSILFLSGRRPLAFRPGTVAVLDWPPGSGSSLDPGTASLDILRAPGEPIDFDTHS